MRRGNTVLSILFVTFQIIYFVRLNLRYTQDREFTGVIIPHTAMVHLLTFLQVDVILQLIIKVFFCFIYYKTITCILKILENVLVYFTHISTDPALQSDSVKMREFHNMNCEWNVASLIDFKTMNYKKITLFSFYLSWVHTLCMWGFFFQESRCSWISYFLLSSIFHLIKKSITKWCRQEIKVGK